MDSLAELLEFDLSRAFEVKDQTFLHRYITLLTQNLVKREDNDREHSDFREAIIRIEEGFKRMDERFEAIQRDMDKRFTMLFSFMSLGFVLLATLMSVYQFLS